MAIRVGYFEEERRGLRRCHICSGTNLTESATQSPDREWHTGQGAGVFTILEPFLAMRRAATRV